MGQHREPADFIAVQVKDKQLKLTPEGQARVDQLTEAYRKLESYLDDRLPASNPEREEARIGLTSSLQSAVAAVWATEGFRQT